MTPAARQWSAVFRREVRKAFLARRGWWIYLLALAPFLLFFAYSVQVHIEAGQRQAWAAQQSKRLGPQDFDAIQRGMPEAKLVAALGEPARKEHFVRRRRGSHDEIIFNDLYWYRYSDGSTLYDISVVGGVVSRIQRRPGPSLGDVGELFANVFEFFYLRLAVFFGCLGIFMNLFRGELLNKSLHFYFLAPVPRSRVLSAKFAAGLVASVAVFAGSAWLQMFLLGRIVGAGGFEHTAAYLGVTALACVGYGAVFLAAGLMFRNPIVPAVALLLWESAVPFLPALLKKISVIYYLMQLCPVNLAAAPGTPALYALLVSSPDAIRPITAIAGLLLLAAVVLWAATRLVRRMEIDYTAE